jgi:cytoskeletal protein CcmA (bactofilin family)
VSDAIVLTQQQPGESQRGQRSSAPRPAGDERGRYDAPESLVPSGFAFEGIVAFDGHVRIDGTVRGDVDGRGLLEVGPGGCIEGEARADELVVAGTIEGGVRGRDRVELRDGARVRGDVVTPSIAVREGAVLDGRCSIESKG